MESQPEIETNDGPQAQRRFVDAMKKILSVPREEMLRREAEYQRQVAAKPTKRGPKPRQKAKS